LLVVIDYLVADINTFVTNVNARAGDQLFDVVLRLAAKRAAKKFFRSAEICHKGFANFDLRFWIAPANLRSDNFAIAYRKLQIKTTFLDAR
jgi:hypothetical protein